MALEFTTSHLADSIAVFRYYQKLGEGAMAQLEDGEFTRTLGDDTNSVATIVKHMAGNMRSRWTNFLSEDGEKADRNRDQEFEAPPATRAEVMATWQSGWQCVFDALTPLSEADLGRTVRIRGEAHSVTQAINRQLTHYAYHVGQIVMLAHQFRGAAWKSLSVPRGKSLAFNQRVASGETSQR